MAKGKGHYFKTKAEAAAAVVRLQKSGVTNIDVGCMQISLHFHPRAFASLEEAFDPAANVAYAARFLKGLHGLTQSWPQAAANYHSSNPLRNESYKAKVLRLWQRSGGGALANLGPMATPDPAYTDPASHASRKALLNARFRARLAAERGASKQARSLAVLNQWRRSRMGPNYRAETAALRRANTARHLRKELTKGKISFATKRRQQLAAWRSDRSANSFGRINPR
ncbi:MAG: murein transglycosylase [Pseudomonadota bacterium]|nr:murein transglycosylase [Pseudomonadota bacterium]